MNEELDEQWKPIIGYEGLYEISNFGRVISCAKEWVCGAALMKKGRKLKNIRINRDGNQFIVLCRKAIKKSYSISLLVYDHFGNKSRGEFYVAHLDGNKQNNVISNLNLYTPRKITQDHFQRNTTKQSSKYLGVRKKRNKWEAGIRIKKHRKHLGVFENEIDAANAYNEALETIKEGEIR